MDAQSATAAVTDLHKRSPNDVKEIRSEKQLERIHLDLESPRLKKAMHNLGVSPREITKR